MLFLQKAPFKVIPQYCIAPPLCIPAQHFRVISMRK